MVFDIGSLGRAVSVIAMVLAAGTTQVQAQFNPFQLFQPQPPPQRPPQQPSQQQQQQQKAQPRPAPPKAQQPPQKAQGAPTPSTPYPEVRSACQSEIRGTCAGVVPGSADSVQCLRRNLSFHSPACQEALNRAAGAAQPTAAAPVQSKPDVPAGTADAPRRVSTDRVAPAATPEEPLKEPPITMRPTQEARFVNRYCKEDHSLLCQGVPFGQGRVLKCLVSHQPSLIDDCKKALARSAR